MSTLMALPPKTPRLIRMLASSNDGECLGAARALGRTLEAAGMSFHDLADQVEQTDVRVVYVGTGAHTAERPTVPPTWESIERFRRLTWLDALLGCDTLTLWERQFVGSLRAQYISQPHKMISPKQRATVNEIMASAWLMGVRV